MRSWSFASQEVVATELLVGAALGEDVVGADEDRVGHGHDRFLVPAAAFDAEVLGAQVGVLGAAGGAVGRLD